MNRSSDLTWITMLLLGVVEASSRIAVVTSSTGPTHRLAQITSEALSYSTTTAEEETDSVEVVWIRAGISSSLNTTRALMSAWAGGRLEGIFGSFTRCATPLELAAAWNIPAFTTGCPDDETSNLRTNNMYWSHVNLDASVFSLIPYVQSLYFTANLLTDWQTAAGQRYSYSTDRPKLAVTSASGADSGSMRQIRKDLSYRGIPAQWCFTNCTENPDQDPYHPDQWCPSNCTDASMADGEVLLVYGTPEHLSTWLQGELHKFVNWTAIIIASNDYIDPNRQYLKLLPDVNNDSKVFLIQPSKDSTHLSREMMYKDSLYIYKSLRSEARAQPRQEPSHALTIDQQTHNIINLLRNNCVKGIESRYCLDGENWSLGKFSLYQMASSSKQRFRNCAATESLHEQDKEIFQLIGDFNQSNHNWIIQTRPCFSTSNTTAGDSESDMSDKVRANKMASTTALIILCVILALILFIGMIVFIYYKLGFHRKGKRNSPKSWHISFSEISPFKPEHGAAPVELDPIFDSGSGCPVIDFGYYRDQPVALKRWSSNGFLLTKAINKDLDLMTSLHHENVATFHGVCVSQQEFVMVNEYCIKGSLEEILMYEPGNLDETFTASLLCDIIKGMTFLHKSIVGVHGNLKSRNCLVTARWVVKLSDFGLPHVRTMFKKDRDLLWCAPEIIEHKEMASQKGDIYSFGVILYELIGKHGPYGAGYHYTEKDLQAVLEKKLSGNYVPETSWLCCEDYLKNIMLSCWQNPPKYRPDFNVLNSQLKPFKAILNGRSIVDNILTIMERYQMRLEDLVDERTAQLMAEKKKTENLLHRMLPPQVAEQLVKGKSVAPESFSCITVFFSDICGFTNLASASTPYQVISLLNDLYTMFDTIIRHYDVYKVETVGDAYLCVSGLPKPNGDQHAAEIALMALEFIQTLQGFELDNNGSTNAEDRKLKMRIGIHSGPCVAGVVGVSMPRYTLFGDTVNVASRLETTSEPMKIQMSESTRQLLDKVGGFYYNKRGTVNLKGKGDMETYWLTGVTNSAGTTVPGRYLTYKDSLTLPGKTASNTSSMLSGLDTVLMSPEITAIRQTRSGSIKSMAALRRADSFRARERTKISLATRLGSRSAESLHRLTTQVSCDEKIPMIMVSDNEQAQLLSQPDPSGTQPITIQVDEF